MNRLIPTPAILLAGLIAATAGTAGAEETSPDLLRLTNGELEGRFGGIDRDGVLRWERDDGVAPMEFRTDKVRQIILRGAASLRTDNSTSHIELMNGDRIPGAITGLDAENLTVDSPAAGLLVIPRDVVKRIAPNPFGGRLIYAGPFDPDEWKIDDGSEPKAAADPEENEEADEQEPPAPEESQEPAEEEKEEEATWRHLGSRWYHVAGGDALTLDADMPRRSVFRFHLDWRGRSPVAVAFHADFAPKPPVEKDDEEGGANNARRVVSSMSELTSYFGRALVMTLRGNYVTLYKSGYGKDGTPYINTIRAAKRSLQIDDSGSADFELRTDLDEGFISLFVNGEFAMQWLIEPVEGDEDDSWTPGGGIGFRVDGSENPLRLSDIILAEWNGMPDAARSLESEEWDVVLLTNGTDRVSGRVETIHNGQLTLEGRYAPLVIPTEEIADIRFAARGLREIDPISDDRIRIHFQPIGIISGVPGVTDSDKMALKSKLMGDLTLDLESAVILEFREGGNFLDAWGDDY
ncbi:hypothetical protein [Haloferula sp. A504]|uniref:hypothetical protein n=1 Tax=Haloferula sp. A504 TaxID=3373601 RepID=UPI0031C63DC9|nr:hypothetical protein [Verrucomicrobiaceae bacterium E54]